MPQFQPNLQNMAQNQLAMAQLQAVQAWLAENNIDPTLPANANLMAQIIPQLQSRMLAQQKANEGNAGSSQSSAVPATKHQAASPQVANDNSPRANSSSDVSGQSNSAKAKQPVSSGPFGSTLGAGNTNAGNNNAMQQFSLHGRENQVRPQAVTGNSMPSMHPLQSPENSSQNVDRSLHVKGTLGGPENMQAQFVRPPNRPAPQAPSTASERALGSQIQVSQGGPAGPASQNQRSAFTKQQLHVLKAQILAFRRIKVCKCSCSLTSCLLPLVYTDLIFR